MWTRWLPWRWVISRIARSRGFIDPVSVLARLERFAQPAEVAEPVELLRAGLIFQARGLINTRAIQHNLDWVWPYWVERQFDPRDPSFVPRAFSVTHVNLTHRNWTAIGVPDCLRMPIVDPRGLVTPIFDGWSLDAWILPADDDAPRLLPSRATDAEQRLCVEDDAHAVETDVMTDGLRLRSRAEVIWEIDQPTCRIRYTATSPHAGWLVLSLRPANPEGVSFIREIRASQQREALHVATIAGKHWTTIRLSEAAERIAMSHYRVGDVYQDLPHTREQLRVECDVGLASAAALFPLQANAPRALTVHVPLEESDYPEPGIPGRIRRTPRKPRRWADADDRRCTLAAPDEKIVNLFDAARRNLVLFSPDECYPGPYTSKRFWFRDAAFILNGLLATGQIERVRRILETHYPARQTALGFFRSQEGEWDANGQALWILHRYWQLTGNDLPDKVVDAIERGANWIVRKRLSDDLDAPHAGLLPAGFSAEHLGPNDHYYWDDFWSVAGLRSAADMFDARSRPNLAAKWRAAADALLAAIDRSLAHTRQTRDRAGVPASPYRRMDAGCIGSLACSYPTHVWAPRDPRLLATIAFLDQHCTVHGGFFQDVIHSGVNAYLTLHLAEAFLRAGDPHHWSFVTALADLASPTGQWPEAVHPNTRGGCMGDGQHIWAASEWVLMLRNCFVREEGDALHIGSGLPAEWLNQATPLRFGPTPTPYGSLTVHVEPSPDGVRYRLEADWRRLPAQIVYHAVGCDALESDDAASAVTLDRRTTAAPQPGARR